MNSRNNFNVAPLFSWPQLSPTGIVLEIGSLGSCSYGESTPRNISWNCMNEVQTCKDRMIFYFLILKLNKISYKYR